MKQVPVLFLDLDGTVRHGKTQLGRFVNSPEDVVVFPEAVAHMRCWKERGGRIVGVTNQGGIALGLADRCQVIEAARETDRQTGYLFDGMRLCPHHPNADDPAQANCWCRKPKPGMLLWAVAGLSRNQRPACGYPRVCRMATRSRSTRGRSSAIGSHAKAWTSSACSSTARSPPAVLNR